MRDKVWSWMIVYRLADDALGGPPSLIGPCCCLSPRGVLSDCTPLQLFLADWKWRPAQRGMGRREQGDLELVGWRRTRDTLVAV